MKLLVKVIAGALLAIGIPITLLAATEVLNPSKTAEQRENSFIAMMLLGLPPTALGGWIVWSLNQRHQHGERDRLRSAFFRLIQENNGHLTVLRFSMETGLDGQTAKTYLDDRAKEFNAAYNVTEEGSYSYHFNLDGNQKLLTDEES
ncbi:MAG: hypothetical protein IGS48_14195 [Oscillatoriales cyanobacterium C42_A2020_001]|nr:hypothetical protein [Leptolyngbyaceae cyanobacterium C42_A2020_001]